MHWQDTHRPGLLDALLFQDSTASSVTVVLWVGCGDRFDKIKKKSQHSDDRMHHSSQNLEKPHEYPGGALFHISLLNMNCFSIPKYCTSMSFDIEPVATAVRLIPFASSLTSMAHHSAIQSTPTRACLTP